MYLNYKALNSTGIQLEYTFFLRAGDREMWGWDGRLTKQRRNNPPYMIYKRPAKDLISISFIYKIEDAYYTTTNC